MLDRTCEHCAAPFMTSIVTQRYCGLACQKAAQYRRLQPKWARRACGWCGKEYTPTRSGQRFCGRGCGKHQGCVSVIPWAQCVECHGWYVKKAKTARRLVCSTACACVKARRERVATPAVQRFCPCGQPRPPLKHYCDDCRALRHDVLMAKVKLQAKVWRKQQRRLGKRPTDTHRRRARRTGADYDPSVTRPAVLERDDWVCGICGRPIPNIAWIPAVADQYGSIDHIVPMSRGGSHTWDNVRAAHHGCNSRRGAPMPGPIRKLVAS